MNQILATENKSKNKNRKNNATGGQIEIRGIIRFFAIAILIFGLVLSSQGVYAIYRDIDDKKPENIPLVTIGRINDKAILHIEHNVNISKLTYYWDNGEETVLTIGDTTATEEITLLGHNSTLYLKIQDINGKIINYSKQYILDGVDITKPTIEQPQTEDGNNKMIITAKDETALSYLSYQWEGKEPVIVEAQTANQTEIKVEVPLEPGTKKIKILAEDQNGNISQLEKTITISTSEPEIYIEQIQGEIFINTKDKDGVKDIVVNLNGKVYSIKDQNSTELRVGPVPLREGNNTILVEVTNISGYTKADTKEIQYIP